MQQTPIWSKWRILPFLKKRSVTERADVCVALCRYYKKILGYLPILVRVLDAVSVGHFFIISAHCYVCEYPVLSHVYEGLLEDTRHCAGADLGIPPTQLKL